MPRKKSDYPDWVMKYKEKGTYINKVGDKYYLYAAHSERIKGTDKVKRVSDGYIGRITEKDGLIKSGSKLKSPPSVFEAGLSYSIISVTENIRDGFKRSFRKNGDMIYCCSVLQYIYSEYSQSLFENSCLSIIYDGIVIPDKFTPAQITGIERGLRMLNDVLPKVFGEDLTFIKRRFTDIRIVRVERTLYLCGTDEQTTAVSLQYGIDWGKGPWQR